MSIILKAAKREDLSSSATKRIRNIGHVPGVVYGKEKENKMVSVDSVELVKTVRDEGRNAIITLEIERDTSIDVMLHEYQMDPIKGELVHVDFYIVDMSEEMDVNVSLHTEGEAPGVKEGGILQQPLFELQVRAKPADIPEEISIDVTAMQIGDSLTVADLPKSDKYTILDEEDTAIAVVLPPEEEKEEADANTSAEPELVGADDDEKEA